jgi:adenine-specific DNA-methyltransferase
MPNLDYRPNQRFWVNAPDGTKFIPPEGKSFRWSKERFDKELENGNVVIKEVRESKLIDENGLPARWIVYQKRFLLDTLEKESARPNNLFENFQNMQSCKEMSLLDIPFDYPKPLSLIKYVMMISKCRGEDIILDFFAGSGTTAHAVMVLNAEDGGKRRCISVQIPQKIDEESEAYKAGYKTIAEIGKERIRRAGKKILEELESKNQQLKLGEEAKDTSKLDIGFRVYKLDSTNMQDVYYHPNKVNQEQLSLSISNVKEGRTAEDLLTQVILDLGLELNLPIEHKNIHGNNVYYVQGNSLVACFDDSIDFGIVDEIAQSKPLKVVFKDAGFKDDKDRINLEERFKRLSPETQIRVI